MRIGKFGLMEGALCKECMPSTGWSCEIYVQKIHDKPPLNSCVNGLIWLTSFMIWLTRLKTKKVANLKIMN